MKRLAQNILGGACVLAVYSLPGGAFKPPSTWPSLLRQPSEVGQ